MNELQQRRTVNSAKLRAALNAFFFRHRDARVTIPDLYDHPEIKPVISETGYTKDAFGFHVRTMSRTGELVMEKGEGNGTGTKQYYRRGEALGQLVRTKGGHLNKRPKHDPVEPTAQGVVHDHEPHLNFVEMVDVEVSGVTLSMAPGTHLYIAKINGRNKVVIG